MGAKKYNPEGVQSMQCKELCGASVMRYGAVQAEAQQDARRNVMLQPLD